MGWPRFLIADATNAVVGRSCVFCRDGYDAADSVRLRRFACMLTSVIYTSIPVRVGPWFPPSVAVNVNKTKGWATRPRVDVLVQEMAANHLS